MRDYLREKGNQNIHGSRDSTREAFKLGLIRNGDSWMDMIKDRNRTSHAYNEETAREIAFNIVDRFFALFVALQETMQGLQDDN